MRQFPSFVVVIRLLVLLTIATITVSLDQADFSARLEQVVDNVLGAKQFEAYMGKLRSNFVSQAPNGRIFTEMVAKDISREVIKRADAVRRNKNTIVNSLGNRDKQPQPKCCPLEPLNFTVDPRFPGITTQVLCHIGKDPETPAEATGVSDTTIKTMKQNLELIPSLKWQYFGNEHGTLYVYPGFPGCGLGTYDPRFRPWYGLTATYPKDMVIMLDKSLWMKNQFGAHKRMYYGIQATKAVIESLNPNDKIGVIAFADDVQYPEDPCYHRDLALATSANKKKLSDFTVLIQPSSQSQANYSKAFTEAFRLLATTGNISESVTTNNRRAKVIILLSAGAQSESPADIQQTIDAGKQLAGRVVILAFGLKTDHNSEEFLTEISSGSFTALNDIDEQTIRARIGVYYNEFTKPSNDENVVFSVPYNDTAGLGMVTSGCLPVFAFGSFQGVTCIDLPLDTLFSPIIDFRLAQLSYAFLIDSRGRVLLHPLLPKPETYKQEPIFLYMESVEISSETPVIKRSMISGVAGNMSIAGLKICPRRGDSPLEGVGFDHQPATYFWHPISEMNASVAIVIIGNEKNNSLSWTTDFPPVLLTDELSVSDDHTQGRCNNSGRVAIRERSAVKLSLQSVKNPYFYREHGIASNTGRLKSYLQGETDVQGSLAVKAGVRESVALTYELERIWKSSSDAASDTVFDVGQLNAYAVYRYVGTREGVYRVYPAVRVPVKFDPTKQPQYRRSEVQRTRTTLYTQTDANGYAVTSLTKAFTDPNKAVVLGVIGADIVFAPLFNFLHDHFDPCKTAKHECFAVDRSGFVIIHKDFIDSPPSSQVHITTKEPQVAADLVQNGIMRNNSCVSYADITNQLFWEVEFSHDLELTNGHIYAITDFDLFVIVKYVQNPTTTGTCTCSPTRGDSGETQCTAGEQCQCPCYTSTDYSYCSGHFTITVTTKTCYPATLPLYLPDLTSEERHAAESLPSCFLCSRYNSENACAMYGCCFSGNVCTECQLTSTSNSGLSGPSCDSVCVGIVVGLVVLVVVVVLAAVLVAWKLGRLPSVGLPSCCQSEPQYTSYPSDCTSSAGSLNTTVVHVNSYDNDGAYARPESVIPQSDQSEYLHLDTALKPPTM